MPEALTLDPFEAPEEARSGLEAASFEYIRGLQIYFYIILYIHTEQYTIRTTYYIHY